jgi:hypothetical protein
VYYKRLTGWKEKKVTLKLKEAPTVPPLKDPGIPLPIFPDNEEDRTLECFSRGVLYY